MYANKTKPGEQQYSKHLYLTVRDAASMHGSLHRFYVILQLFMHSDVSYIAQRRFVWLGYTEMPDT